ncbi:MAG: 3-deoxy-7-phosphoheptulonate synthase [Ruminococcaceae bacterium]|nr:3-deoxy-7-phosphoheptulonate synthase [Oscillospiraceae bacterium]
MEFVRKLPLPKEIREQYPLSAECVNKKIEFDREVAKIFSGESSKKLLIIGPCSADNEDSVMDYVTRLARVSEKVSDKIVVIPRVYTNKPRTTGDGYKGMLHQPDPNKDSDMLAGIIAIRHLHKRVIEQTGMFTADEMLYPENYQYLYDLLSYVAIGARSVENQQHRLVSSGIEIPVGMKNPTGGDISVMLNSIMAAQHPHTFLYRGWEVKSSGNPYAHAILRGYVNKHGESLPNYHYEDIEHLCKEYDKRTLVNPALIVDCNHANSGKKYKEQVRIAKEVLHSCALNPDIAKIFKGFMIESYIEEGNQKIGEGIYGKSITDACLGWEDTERFIYYMAERI